MKIDAIIRERRLARHFTQEQVANCLGVTASAVNKWEKGVSYPDITLLPALARLLETDLNTLLSFQEDLTEQEVALCMNEVSDCIRQQGFAAGYALAEAKLRQWPTCGLLVCSLAMLLDGALVMFPPQDGGAEAYRAGVEALYRRAAQSGDAAAREQAQARLIAGLVERQEYEEAQQMLDALPRESPVDRGQIQAKLLLARGETARAGALLEQKLLSALNEIHAVLTTLLEIALKEGREADAAAIAGVDEQAARLFDLWEFNRYAAQFQLCILRQDGEACLQLLAPMLRSLTKQWELGQSPLYRHTPAKAVDEAFGPMLQRELLRSLREDEDTAFLRGDPRLEACLASFS